MRVTCVYATPEQQSLLDLELPDGCTVGQALRYIDAAAFGLQSIDGLPVGIFGERVELAQRLQDGDRLEFYRPLQADPKHARRERVRSARQGRAR
ncbi:RnfH family protein [Solimonas marina]|uniref:UPF0125 protein G7Y82_12610 n=1 Tax=Solimonas marina TaxID=2714601 RepID=A0A969WD17_9GAMM|nr:RnfH family protein [Solimonas marina]NKF23161.1 RnfH family protein [Solimonas marina]